MKCVHSNASIRGGGAWKSAIDYGTTFHEEYKTTCFSTSGGFKLNFNSL